MAFKYDHIKVGDVVSRWVANMPLMKLKVTAVDETLIHCGDWKFSRKNGAEIDEDLDWNEQHTGSYLMLDN